MSEYQEVKEFLEKTIEEKGNFKIIYFRSSTVKKIYNVLKSLQVPELKQQPVIIESEKVKEIVKFKL